MSAFTSVTTYPRRYGRPAHRDGLRQPSGPGSDQTGRRLRPITLEAAGRLRYRSEARARSRSAAGPGAACPLRTPETHDTPDTQEAQPVPGTDPHTPAPGPGKFQDPPTPCPASPKMQEKFPDQQRPHRLPRAPGPDYTQNRGPIATNIPPSIKHAGGAQNDTNKGDTGALYRMLRRQHERGAAMPCGKMPPTPLQNGPQATEAGHRYPGRP